MNNALIKQEGRDKEDVSKVIFYHNGIPSPSFDLTSQPRGADAKSSPDKWKVKQGKNEI